jgi:hypothetical protein
MLAGSTPAIGWRPPRERHRIEARDCDAHSSAAPRSIRM